MTVPQAAALVSFCAVAGVFLGFALTSLWAVAWYWPLIFLALGSSLAALVVYGGPRHD